MRARVTATRNKCNLARVRAHARHAPPDWLAARVQSIDWLVEMRALPKLHVHLCARTTAMKEMVMALVAVLMAEQG